MTLFWFDSFSQSDNAEVKGKMIGNVYIKDIFINFDSVTTRQYFDTLKLNGDTSLHKLIVFIGHGRKNWISKNDIKYLIQFVYSTEKCACVWAMYANYVPPFDYSTLGAQAILLIESYRQDNEFFPGLRNCDKTDFTKAKEIEEWWESYKNK